MTHDSTIRDRLHRIFTNKLNVDVPSGEDVNLIESGILDSLLIVELLTQIEQEFKTKIPIEELEIEHFHSLESLSRFLARRGPVVAGS